MKKKAAVERDSKADKTDLSGVSEGEYSKVDEASLLLQLRCDKQYRPSYRVYKGQMLTSLNIITHYPEQASFSKVSTTTKQYFYMQQAA